MDTYVIAIEKFKALISEDTELPQEIKQAAIADCSSTPPAPTQLQKLLEGKNAPTP